jgi:hypothetical protein
MAAPTSQFFGFAAGVPERGPAVTATTECAAGGAAPKPDTLAGGPCCRPRSRGGPAPGARDQFRREKHPDRQTYRWSGVPNAGPVLHHGPEPGRRLVPGERFGPVTDAGQDASPKAGLPVPGRGVRSAPGPRWPGQGQAAHDFRPTAPSTTLGGNRAPALVQLSYA